VEVCVGFVGACVCWCVYVCAVRERERGREGGREGGRKRESAAGPQRAGVQEHRPGPLQQDLLPRGAQRGAVADAAGVFMNNINNNNNNINDNNDEYNGSFSSRGKSATTRRVGRSHR
jgi:hypothetical protein